MADFFDAGLDEREAESERIRDELEELRSVTMLAVAQARRTELELREALRAERRDTARMAELVPRLEEERARADTLMQLYREREAEEEERLVRLGQVRLAEEINERRRDLRGEIDLVSRTSREDELTEMEDEARSEAFRLDVLTSLDAGEDYRASADQSAGTEELEARARKLLEEPVVEGDSEEA